MESTKIYHYNNLSISYSRVGIQDEKPLPADGEIQIVVGEPDVPLGELLGYGGHPDTAADGVGGDTQVGGRKDIGEFGP